ncbi:MAG: ferritin-like domain-containing protein [Pseudonocardia sp.]
MTNSTLIHQLRALEQLTGTEAQIARVRVAQARTEAVRRELRRNAANADRRRHRIASALDELGAVPDVVTPALGRLLAFAKAAAEQVQPIDEALLGDLALEHQLRDRARYATVLAAQAKRPGIEKLADELVDAHSATVDWITTVLAEDALGGPAALQATPVQRFAAGVGKAVSGPARFAVERVNRAAHTISGAGAKARDLALDTAGDVRDRAVRTGEQLREGAEEAAAAAQRLGHDAADVATTGRDAALERAEQVAERENAGRTADAVHATRRDLGALTAAELPITGYEEMNAPDAIAAVRELTDPDDINAVIAFEEAHKNRSGVVSAAQTRFAALAKDAAGVS